MVKLSSIWPRLIVVDLIDGLTKNIAQHVQLNHMNACTPMQRQTKIALMEDQLE